MKKSWGEGGPACAALRDLLNSVDLVIGFTIQVILAIFLFNWDWRRDLKLTDYFDDLIPTTENFAKILYECIDEKLSKEECNLLKVRLYETKDLFVDYWKDKDEG